MSNKNALLIGKGNKNVYLNPRYANRHGLIAGATGTGKTVTLQVLAEGFSRMGVPVFLSDIKGDLSGLITPASSHKKRDERIQSIGINDYQAEGFPTVFWDLHGQQGHPVRATISDMGPLLLSRLLELNETQEGIMNIAFRVADEQGLLLLDLKDLRSMLRYVSEERKQLQITYGNISSASIGAIQRRLLVLEEQGAEHFFGEPALELWDFLRNGNKGYGQINLLVANKLINTPRLYATFLLWLMSELFENLPEQGDQDKPRLVFFFDEAHLLFDGAPKALTAKIEQVVKLIRSKGVGIYFVTQNPLDIPDGILSQLGNRIQHALRAYTPREQKAVKVAASTFRANPAFDTGKVIMELGVGEALVSVLEDKGIPSIVERTLICPPSSFIGPATDVNQIQARNSSPLAGRYDKAIDRESAYEILKERAKKAQEAASQAILENNSQKSTRRSRQSIGEAFIKSIARSIGTRVGRSIVRGLLGSIFKG